MQHGRMQKSNSKTLNQCNITWCNIKTVQHLIVQYYNSTILNGVTITIAKFTNFFQTKFTISDLKSKYVVYPN